MKPPSWNWGDKQVAISLYRKITDTKRTPSILREVYKRLGEVRSSNRELGPECKKIEVLAEIFHGSMRVADNLFQNIENRTGLHSYMFMGYANNKMENDMFRIIQQELVDNGEISLSTYKELMAHHSRVGASDKADALFEDIKIKIPSENIPRQVYKCWMLATHDNFELAKSRISYCLDVGIEKPICLLWLIESLLISTKQPEVAEEAISWVTTEEPGIVITSAIWRELLRGYSLKGDFNSLLRLKDKNFRVTSWFDICLITACRFAIVNQPNEIPDLNVYVMLAEGSYISLLDQTKVLLRDQMRSLDSLVYICASALLPEKANKYYFEIQSRSTPSRMADRAMSNMYSRLGDLEKAQKYATVSGAVRELQIGIRSIN